MRKSISSKEQANDRQGQDEHRDEPRHRLDQFGDFIHHPACSTKKVE